MIKDNYDKLLETAYSSLPESTKKTSERFEIPKVKGLLQKNKTIISNFLQIANALHREPQHLMKYLLRELATPGDLDGQRLILKRKLSSSLINSIIEKYAREFVICSECGKPDTKLGKEEIIVTIKCMACGAKHPVKAKI